MSDNVTTSPKPMSARVQVRVFMFSMLAWLLLVHVWGLGLSPIGPNENPEGLAWGYHHFLQLERVLIGKWILGYQLVNLLLLYGCMVSLFFLTWHVLRGPIWMGSLAATLMMAHPMKSESLRLENGSHQLLIAFFSLSCLALYMAHTRWGGHWHYRLAVLTFVLLSPFVEVQLGILLILALMEWGIVPKFDRLWSRLFPFWLIAMLALIWSEGIRVYGPLSNDLVTLFLSVYPLGLLPETAKHLLKDPQFMMTAVWSGFVVVILLGLAVRQREYWIMLLASVFYAWVAELGVVGWVDFYFGGGRTILPISLVAIAFCAVVQHIFQEERWRKPMILLTSLLCMFFFSLQIREYARIRAEQNHETGKSWIQEMREWENGTTKQVK